MKVLLLNPPPRMPDNPNVLVPPLGLAYLAAVLEKNHLPVEILDANVQKLSWEKFREIIRQKKPDIIGITGMTPTIDTTFKAARICRPYTKYLVLGGPHGTMFGRQVFQQTPDFDFLVLGEGEYTFLNLVKALVNKENPVKIPGISTRNENNPPPPLIADLNNLPFPARHLLPNDLYRYALTKSYPFTTLFTSRGCPYQCLFCEKRVFGQKYRARSPENVLAEIEEVIRKYRIRSIVFFDDLFTLNKERVIKICEGILKRNLKFDWKAEARVNTVDEQMLKMMKRAGCSLLAFGVESGNQKSLDFLQKNTTVSQIRKAFRLTQKSGIKTLGYFILGIPGESYRQAQQTIEFSLDLKCDFAQFSILTPYPGTKLYDLALNRGWIKTTAAQNPFDQDIEKPVLLSPGWTPDKFKKILKVAHRRFYFRPGYIFNQLLSLKNPTQAHLAFQNGWRVIKWYCS